MIVEFSKYNETVYTLPKSLKLTKKLEADLLEKIKTKKKEPFASIKIFMYVPILPKLMDVLKKEGIQIKGMIANNVKVGIEI